MPRGFSSCHPLHTGWKCYVAFNSILVEFCNINLIHLFKNQAIKSGLTHSMKKSKKKVQQKQVMGFTFYSCKLIQAPHTCEVFDDPVHDRAIISDQCVHAMSQVLNVITHAIRYSGHPEHRSIAVGLCPE